MTFSLSDGNANEIVTWRSKFALRDYFAIIPIRSTCTMNYQVTEQLRNAFKFKKMKQLQLLDEYGEEMYKHLQRLYLYLVVLWRSRRRRRNSFLNYLMARQRERQKAKGLMNKTIAVWK